MEIPAEVTMVPLWMPVLVAIIGLVLGALFAFWLNNFLSADDVKGRRQQGKTLGGIRYDFLAVRKGKKGPETQWNIEEVDGAILITGPTDHEVVQAVEQEDRQMRSEQATAMAAAVSRRGDLG